MRIEQFEAILATAELHSMQKAAENLYTTSQNISKLIKDFEKDLGVSVFQRNRHGVFLTNDGEYIAKELKEVMSHLNGLREYYSLNNTHLEDKSETKKSFIESLNILSVPANDSFLSSMIDYLNPRFKVENALLDFQDAMWIYDTLESNPNIFQKYDIIFSNVLEYQFEYLKQHYPAGTIFFLTKNRFGIQVHKDHPLCAHESVSIKELLDLPLIVHISDGQKTTMHLQALQNLGCALKPKYVVKSQNACQAMIQKKMGYSLINYSCLNDFLQPEDLVRIPLKEKLYSYHICIFNPKILSQPYYPHIQSYITRNFKYCQQEN